MPKCLKIIQLLIKIMINQMYLSFWSFIEHYSTKVQKLANKYHRR